MIVGDRHTVAEEDQRLGANLAAAFIATSHGIGLDYARKKYVEGKPVGEYWIALARKVIEDHIQRPAQQPRRDPTVQ